MTLRRRLANSVARAARRLWPTAQAEWGDAVLSELHYVGDHDALGWAWGFLMTSTKERMRTMNHEMTARQARRLNIVFSAVYAALLLIVTFAVKHSRLATDATTVYSVLTALWLVPFGYLSRRESACRRTES